MECVLMCFFLPRSLASWTCGFSVRAIRRSRFLWHVEHIAVNERNECVIAVICMNYPARDECERKNKLYIHICAKCIRTKIVKLEDASRTWINNKCCRSTYHHSSKIKCHKNAFYAQCSLRTIDVQCVGMVANMQAQNVYVACVRLCVVYKI